MIRYNVAARWSRGAVVVPTGQTPLGPAGPRLLAVRTPKRPSRGCWPLLGSIGVHACMALAFIMIARRMPTANQPVSETITLVFAPATPEAPPDVPPSPEAAPEPSPLAQQPAPAPAPPPSTPPPTAEQHAPQELEPPPPVDLAPLPAMPPPPRKPIPHSPPPRPATRPHPPSTASTAGQPAAGQPVLNALPNAPAN